MKDTEFKYDAFISYRHAPLDSFVAENLHRMLENFRVPKLADKSLQEKQRRRINRVFRDKNELPVSSNLADPITEALLDSEYLIVICSPRTPESVWVQTEIETFIRHRGQEHVLAVLIEGEPAEAFPDAMCHLDGKLVEPLAADVRGDTRRRVYHNMKNEIYRIVAPILGCEYDDLKQRHKEQRLKIRLAISCSVGAVFLAFAAYSTYQAGIISEKSAALAAENENNQILQSKSLSKQALDLYESGDRIRGILLARSALPQNQEKPERPFVAEAQSALTEALQVYQTKSRYLPFCQLEQETTVDFVKMSPDGTTVMTKDTNGTLYLWDAQTGKLLNQCKEQVNAQIEDNFQYINENTFVEAGTGGICIYQLPAMEVLWENHELDATEISLGEADGKIAAADGYTAEVYDYQKGETLYHYEAEEDYAILNGLSMSPDGSCLSVGLYAGPDRGAAKLVRINLAKQQILGTEELPYDWITEAHVSNQGDFYVLNKDTVSSGSFLSDGKESMICFQTSGQKKWQLDTDMTMNHDMRFLTDGNLSYISGTNLFLLSAGDGTQMKQIGYSDIIVNYRFNEKSGTVVSFLADGTAQRSSTREADEVMTCLQTKQATAKWMDMYDDTIVTFAGDTDEVYLYKASVGTAQVNTQETDGYIMGMLLSQDDQKSAAFSYQTEKSKIYAYDQVSHQKLWEQELADPSGMVRMLNSPDGSKLMVLTFCDVYLFDWQSGELLDTWNREDIVSCVVDDSGETMYLFLSFTCEVYDLKEMKQITEFDYSGVPGNLQVIRGTATGIGTDYEQNGVIMDLMTGEQTPLPWNSTQFAYSPQAGEYLIANTQTEALELYSIQDHKLLGSVPASCASLEGMRFNQAGDLFYVQNLRHEVTVYRTKDMEVVKRILTIDQPLGEWKSLTDGRQVLYDSNFYHTKGYLCTKDMDVIASIPELWAVSSAGDYCCSAPDNRIFTFSVYSLTDLLAETEKQLDGRVLTEEEKEKYYVEN